MTGGWVLQSGVVLFLERYAEGVAFYRDTLQLPLIDAFPGVTILGFGAGYLMLETAPDIAHPTKSRAQNPAVLRFNVADVQQRAAELSTRGVAIAVSQHDWGTIARFRDPDGNPCELRNGVIGRPV